MIKRVDRLGESKINNLFIKSNTIRGDLPIGVIYNRTKKRYIASMRKSLDKRKRLYLGVHDTPLEAFNSYKQAKQQYIKEAADDYKSKYPNFPDKLYQAMYNYEVEITD